MWDLLAAGHRLPLPATQSVVLRRDWRVVARDASLPHKRWTKKQRRQQRLHVLRGGSPAGGGARPGGLRIPWPRRSADEQPPSSRILMPRTTSPFPFAPTPYSCRADTLEFALPPDCGSMASPVVPAQAVGPGGTVEIASLTASSSGSGSTT